MFRSLLVGIISLFLFVNNCLADVDIPKKHWVPNKPNGYCCYAAMETVGRFYSIENLYAFKQNGKTWGLAEWYEQWESVGASDKDVNDSLTNLGVKYNIYYDKDINWLKKQTDKEVPVIVSSWWEAGNHAYIAVDVTDKWIKIIDSNRTNKYHWLDKQWFIQNWNKWGLIIHNK